MDAEALRLNGTAVEIARGFVAAGKPIAAICHAPWTLVEAGAVDGKRLTSFRSLRTDLRNTGGDWVDEAVVVDGTDGWTLITSKDADDLDAFVGAVDERLAAVPA